MTHPALTPDAPSRKGNPTVPIQGQVAASDFGKAMPVNSTPYGVGTPTWTHTDAIAFQYRTDPAQAAAVLPAQFEIDDNPTAALLFFDYGISGVGGYREVVQSVEVTVDGKKAHFIRHIYVTNDTAMAGGRELLGHPKMLAEIHFDWRERSSAGLLHGRIERPAGVPLAYGVFKPQIYAGPMSGTAPVVGLRHLPASTPGQPPAISEFVFADVTAEADEVWFGTGAPALTGYSTIDPLHQLPVVEPLQAIFATGIKITGLPAGVTPVR
jgi:acetoacetate decarboxylase